MRGFAIALVALAACGKSAPKAEPARDAAVVAKVTIEAAPLVLDAAPAKPLGPAEIEARYAEASQHANEPRGLALLREVVLGGGDVDRARWDDAWASQWDQPGFRAVVELVPDVAPDAGDAGVDEEDEDAAPKLACPPGTKLKGKWTVDDDGQGTLWCARRDGTKHGPFASEEQGYDEGEGVRSSSGAYQDGRKHGLWHESESFGEYTYGAYVANVRHGLWVIGRNNDDVTRYVVYVGGKEQGLATAIADDDGAIVSEDRYDHGVAHGVFAHYEEDAPHELEEQGAYDHGKKTGEWVSYRNGQPTERTHWDAGVAHGAFTFYDDTGTIVAATTLDHGTGKWIAYSGTQLTQGALDHGARTGTWTTTDVATKIKRAEGDYARDKRIGPWRYWRDDGTLRAEGGFAVGQLEGEWRIFGDDGIGVAQTLTFKADKLVRADGERAGHVDFDASSFADSPDVVDVTEEEDDE